MEQKKWLTYWKKSLSDSLKADINIDSLKWFEIKNFNINTDTIIELEKVNELIDFEEERINRKKGVIKESENWAQLESIQIVIAPIKVIPIPEHLVFLKDKTSKFPFWFYATINRKGEMKIPEEIVPIFQRKYLEPLADERTEFIFSSVEMVDVASSMGKEKYDSYKDYIDNIKNIFKIAINQDLDCYKSEGYETVSNALLLVPDEDINAAVGIIHLYEKIIKEENLPELLSKFIDLKNTVENKPLAVADFIDVNFQHLGQMGFEFPISISQRKSLYTQLHSNDKVFAVNGPPGTGKTTLLQSIVANKMVLSALAGGDPSIILACSTNNQAVTNIIDSFSKSNTSAGLLKGRWLPDIKGYATYLPANGKTAAELKGINYKKQRGEGLFSMIECPTYLATANISFLEKCEAYFGTEDMSIETSIQKLQNEIAGIQNQLIVASQKWKNYLKAEIQFATKYNSGNIGKAGYYADNILNEQTFSSDIASLTKLEERILAYFKNESFFRKLFCLFGFGAALKNRASEIKIILRDSLIQISDSFKFTQSDILQLIDNKIILAKIINLAINEWKVWKQQNNIRGNPPRDETEYWAFENTKIAALKINDLAQSAPNCFYDELDVTLRHKAFQLALHYWEGRWLLQIDEDLKNPNFERQGEDAVKNRWLRHAMITPCFVSTFYMAPKFFSSYKFFKKGEDGKNIFDTPPLFNFIDLLIVDEAGQVSPEVGIATFSLAKQAVIVGDIKQIEPVWNISNKIDIGNLKKGQLIKDYNDLIFEQVFDPKGFLSSTGSLMKMAQNACNFKENNSVEKGVTLLEHRRCYDEIITYCNVLAYNGQLKALKGKAKPDILFPPMFCIHVEGNSTTANASRYNHDEVNAIVKWLITNKSAIEAKYGQIENAIGIITPFVGQKNSLWYALKKAGFNVNIMKLGTVHALQGAERPIVIFSMVYGKGDSGTMFFDRDNKPNMLNVAVSRARDNFIVFANTAILDKKSKSPSGILANHLIFEDR